MAKVTQSNKKTTTTVKITFTGNKSRKANNPDQPKCPVCGKFMRGGSK